MPSKSRTKWRLNRSTALNELQTAHSAVGAGGHGRRYATQQINQAYALMLSSHFQGFCRDLYCEAADHLVAHLSPPALLRAVVRKQFTIGLKLNQGNPTPGNLGADFGRLGVNLWTELENHDKRNARRKLKLKTLCDWRNAIAHYDFKPSKLGGRTRVRLGDVGLWRSACDALTTSLDAVIHSQLLTLVGVPPW